MDKFIKFFLLCLGIAFIFLIIVCIIGFCYALFFGK